jgi:ribosomal protein S12 methylthiotransferase accessory factor
MALSVTAPRPRTTFHACEPDETVARLRPRLSGYGITRLANITGLDRVGIPVWSAVRPNSRSLAVSQGKGLTDSEAQAAALGEAIETWYAERFEGPLIVARYDDLRGRAPVADPGLLPIARDSPFTPFESIPWVEAEDLLHGGPIWVPFELVHADATVPRVPGSGNFIVSTNGLASGNSLNEATLGALCEVIERDAHAVWRAAGPRRGRQTRVRAASVADPACRWLLERFGQAENDVMIWDITSGLGVPAFRVIAYDRWADSPLAPYPGAYGAAAHLDPATALAKALSEAAQSRLTSIAGVRDDMTPASYAATQSAYSRAGYAALSRQPGRLDFGRVRGIEAHDVQHAVERVLDRLRAAGLRSAARVRLSPTDAPLCVVRVIVAGLEGPSSSPSYVPGRRARRPGPASSGPGARP